MLRVEGFKRPYAKKQEEVRRASKRAAEASDVAQFQIIKCEIETKAELMQQAENVRRLMAELAEANSSKSNMEAALANTQAKLANSQMSYDVSGW